MSTGHWNTLVSPQSLHEHLHSDRLVIVDCRFTLGDPEAGRQAYRTAHLPGAVYAHLDQDLSGPLSARSGRHPLPDVRTLSATLGSWGIDGSKQVIAYDADTGAMAAARLWWLLRWLGHEQVAVLDGGIQHWQAGGFELVSSSFVPAARHFRPDVRTDWLVDADTVAEQARQPGWRVLDVRATERYAGDLEPLDPLAGHVPGARNHPFTRTLDQGRLLPAATLRDQFQQSLGDINPRQVITMCGSGVTACHTLLALTVAGMPGAKLYPGSWSEWSRQGRPVTTGIHP